MHSLCAHQNVDHQKMKSDTSPGFRWICLGEHEVEGGNVESKAVGNTEGSSSLRDTSPHNTSPRDGSAHDTSSRGTSQCGTSPCGTDANQNSTQNSNSVPLVGCQDDILIPTAKQIHDTFTAGQSMWSSYVSSAEQLSPNILPACCLQPSNMLKDVPPIPENLRGKQDIIGQALWNIPCPELANASVRSSARQDETDEPWDPENVFGAQKTFHLRIGTPIICEICSEPAFAVDRTPYPNGLAILTLCWSYIFSVRLLELQHRPIKYSAIMSPILTHDVEQQQKDVIVYLGCSSKKLVRWLCAVLAPGAGWFATGSVPPWTAHCNQDVRFLVSTNLLTKEVVQEKPPSFTEAADLIFELCALYNFGSQPTEAFLIALLFPFYAAQDLQPRLPMPRIPRPARTSHKAPVYIRDYLNDIRYYITLSISSLGSAIWSIFWEPGIQANVASPWLGSIHQVLRPLLEAGDMGLLAKVFAIRNPKLAPLWLGFLRCGSSQVLDMIKRYLVTHKERPQSRSLGHPDPDVAAWTGSKQSFLDEECSSLYESHDALVPAADVLRHRFNFRLADEHILYFGWQPFGVIQKKDIEPELWLRLESPPSRRYVQWVWWLGKIKAEGCYLYENAIEKGYRHDKRDIQDDAYESTAVPFSPGCKDFTTHTPKLLATDPALFRSLKQGPSKEATVRVLKLGSWDASGDRSLDAMGIAEVRKHRWLRGERETCELSNLDNAFTDGQ
ncbi:hypothetical protein G7Y89_g2724 [Cudoniella acicularis]|uniref:Uncharacterized protein n=1 Tax=Cudoniella acicularis TaxID=354080 RepID=A0A8H4RVS5_9HELO|nr:hypothetical protein G7Y89_g2724 [Cudoniella acicularis]